MSPADTDKVVCCINFQQSVITRYFESHCFNSSLTTIKSVRNLGFVSDDHLTFSDQISAISKACITIFDSFVLSVLTLIPPHAACTTASSIVHSKLDYCNCLYYNLPKPQITRLQQTQNSLALAVVKAPKSRHVTHTLFTGSKYSNASVTYKVLTTAHPPYLHNLISVQLPLSTRSSSLVTLARPPTSSSLRITDRRDRCFRYASLCLWNQLPSSFRQPHSSPSVFDLPVHAATTSSHSVMSPLSASITPFLFHPRLFHKFFPP